MRKLIAVIPDKVEMDLGPLLAIATMFQIEQIENGMDLNLPATKVKRQYLTPAGLSRDDVLMSHFTPQGVFSITQCQNWLTKVGFGTKVNSLLSRMKRAGHIRGLGKGKYQFVKPLKPAASEK